MINAMSKDFYHDTPPRIMGSETEYTTQEENHGHGINILNHIDNSKFLSTFSPENDASIWLTNGARLYIDYGDLCEYATPECTSAHEVLAHEKAGEITVQQMVARAHPSNRVYKRTGYDDTRGKDGTKILSAFSAGHHENYYTPLAQSSEQSYAMHALHAYLSTRHIWSGTGMVGEFGYVISQKADAIDFSAKNNLTEHGSKIPHRLNANNRLEVRVGEGNMSNWAVVQKFAMTSLVLRLIEHDRFPKHLIPESSPTWIMRFLSYNPMAAFEMSDQEITATQHQREIAEHALDFAMEHVIDIPSEEITAAEEILRACDDIDQFHAYEAPLEIIADRIDWAAKLDLMHSRGIADSEIMTANFEAVMMDIKWEDISKRGISRLWYSKRQRPSIKPDAITRAEYKAPNTRAALRSKLAMEAKTKGETIHLLDWNTIEGDSSRRSLDDPYAAHM